MYLSCFYDETQERHTLHYHVNFLGHNGKHKRDTRTYHVNFLSHPKGGIVLSWIEAGFSVTWHVQYHDSPLLGHTLHHSYPRLLVAGEAVEEEEGRGGGRVWGAGGCGCGGGGGG